VLHNPGVWFRCISKMKTVILCGARAVVLWT
jgi:hypothetical protein